MILEADLERRILAHIKKLEGFGTRYYDRDGNRAAQEYIEACLREDGYLLERSYSEFKSHRFVSPWTIKAAKANTSGKLFLLTAHFDSISEDKDRKILEEAPGADDNASGVAVLLEMAKALSKHELEQSVGFVFFNVEEVGQFGSKQFAKEWKEQGKRLDGVINIDTIGTWPLALSQGGKVNFVTNEASRPLVTMVEQWSGLSLKSAATPWEDDHASFWAEGFQAIELTEEGCTPVMHSPQDTSEKIDVASVAAVAEALIRLFQNRL